MDAPAPLRSCPVTCAVLPVARRCRFLDSLLVPELFRLCGCALPPRQRAGATGRRTLRTARRSSAGRKCSSPSDSAAETASSETINSSSSKRWPISSTARTRADSTRAPMRPSAATAARRCPSPRCGKHASRIASIAAGSPSSPKPRTAPLSTIEFQVSSLVAARNISRARGSRVLPSAVSAAPRTKYERCFCATAISAPAVCGVAEVA